MPAVQIGVHGHTVTGFQSLGIVFRDGEDFSSQLVSDHTGIRYQSIGSAKGIDITATDPGGSNFDKGFARLQRTLLNLFYSNLPRLRHINRFHIVSTPPACS